MHEMTHTVAHGTVRNARATRKVFLPCPMVTLRFYDVTAVTVDNIWAAHSSRELMTLVSRLWRLWLGPPMFGTFLAGVFVSLFLFSCSLLEGVW